MTHTRLLNPFVQRKKEDRERGCFQRVELEGEDAREGRRRSSFAFRKQDHRSQNYTPEKKTRDGRRKKLEDEDGVRAQLVSSSFLPFPFRPTTTSPPSPFLFLNPTKAKLRLKMYHLLTGLHAYLTRKETFSVIIIGLDNAGKTTMLEQIKVSSSSLYPSSLRAHSSFRTQHQYNPNTPSPDVTKIAPTVGQGGELSAFSPPPPSFRELTISFSFVLVGKISLPSTILQFWDLGGQRDIRSIWSKYYEECHAVVYVVDAADSARLEEGWEVFGESSRLSLCLVVALFLSHVQSLRMYFELKAYLPLTFRRIRPFLPSHPQPPSPPLRQQTRLS